MFENKSILEITSLIKSKEILVKDVVEFYLERIKKYNPALNAIVLQKEEEKIFDEVNLKDKEDDKLKPVEGRLEKIGKIKNNSNSVTIEITAREEICEYQKGIDFLGRPLCKAAGRDSGARINSDIAVISGYATSGGSRNNWTTILNEGTVLRLQMSSKLLELYQDDRFDVKIIK